MDSIIQKLENPIRVKELNIENTLKRLGLSNETSFCDIGTGTGLFSLAAAKLSEKPIYALEISEDMLNFLKQQKQDQNLKNLIVKKVESNIPLEKCSCNICLLATVYHELEEPEHMLNEIHRILSPNGILGIIEFHRLKTPMGPPLSHRISKDELQKQVERKGFVISENFRLGENFYCSIFKSTKL